MVDLKKGKKLVTPRSGVTNLSCCTSAAGSRASRTSIAMLASYNFAICQFGKIKIINMGWSTVINSQV